MTGSFGLWKRIPAVALVIVVLTCTRWAGAAIPTLDTDGWYTWRVEAIDNSTRCCGTWSGGRLVSRVCHLDTGKTVAGCAGLDATGEIQVYVRVERGEVTRVRAFSPTCPVETESKLRDLGRVDNRDSVLRLGSYVVPGSYLGDEALAAIAAHAGPEAFAFLREATRDPQIRERALFWLVQTDTDEAYNFVESLVIVK